MNIREFIDNTNAERKRKYRNQSAAEVLLGQVSPDIKDWRQVFKDGGYYDVVPPSISQWKEIHQWCVRTFGQEHYAWSGNRFWFETPEDAIMFALRWGSL
jgi:hypothetical protein